MKRERPPMREGWPAFLLWAGAGFLWSFGILSWIGVVAWVPAGLLTAYLVGHSGSRTDVLGLAAGVGTFLLLVGVIHIGDNPCPDSGPTFGSCGGINSKPWLASGAVLGVAAVALYGLLRRGSFRVAGK